MFMSYEWLRLLLERRGIAALQVETSFFCFKQKTAYEMRISDWSSDVCSSDLIEQVIRNLGGAPVCDDCITDQLNLSVRSQANVEIGRASCRERVCQYV